MDLWKLGLNGKMDRDIQSLSGVEFEIICKHLLEKMGFSVETTKTSGDGGIDLIAINTQPIFSGKYIVQCKRYTGSVGEPVIRDLYGVVTSERANKGVLMTSGHFTKSAVAFAEGKPIELINGVAMRELFGQYGILADRTYAAERVAELVPEGVFAAYQETFAEQWNCYLEYIDMRCRIGTEARAVGERIVDREIRREEERLSELQHKRGALKLLAFNERKELDGQIQQQTERIEALKQNRTKNIGTIESTLSYYEIDQNEFLQYASESEHIVDLRTECVRAGDRMMFPAEYDWAWSRRVPMSREEFEAGFLDRYLPPLLAPCIKEMGIVKVKDLAQRTGFPEELLLNCGKLCAGIAFDRVDPDTGEILLISREYL